MPGRAPKQHLPYDRWPEADCRLWTAATLVDDDPFSDAAGARLSTATITRLLNGWRRFLGYLSLEDRTAFDIPAVERLTPDRIKSFARNLAATNKPASVALQVEAVYHAARIMMPGHDWSWLKAVKSRLHAVAPPPAAKGPVITSIQLLGVGQKLMDEITPKIGGVLGMADAIQYRDGLMIALLAFIPLRRRNVAGLEIGRHLVRDGDAFSIVIPGAETKTNTLVDYPVPELLTPYLHSYLEHVRTCILSDASSTAALWVSPKGGALSYSAVWGIITRHTLKRLGIRISPHDVRDAAATMWAIADPQNVGVSRDLLGHNDLRTTERHYNRARGVEASRKHSELLNRYRRKPPT